MVDLQSDGDQVLRLSNVTVAGCTANTLGGGLGAVVVGDVATQGDRVMLDGGSFVGNAASVGGGVYSGVGLTAFGTRFESNTALDPTVGGGGAVVEAASCRNVSASFDRCVFVGNEAVGDGGGLLVKSASSNVTGSTFDGNSAGARGGGIAFECSAETCAYSQRSSCVAVASSIAAPTITNNVAEEGSGMFVSQNLDLATAFAVSANSTLVMALEGNSAAVGGGVMADPLVGILLAVDGVTDRPTITGIIAVWSCCSFFLGGGVVAGFSKGVGGEKVSKRWFMCLFCSPPPHTQPHSFVAPIKAYTCSTTLTNRTRARAGSLER